VGGRRSGGSDWIEQLKKDFRIARSPVPSRADCVDGFGRCPACRQFSRAYLHHVVKSGEIIAAMLLTWHNLTFYQDLMESLRAAIAKGAVKSFMKEYRYRQEQADEIVSRA